MGSEGDGVGFIAGFFVGALVGAAVGLLLAPVSGEEMRKEISQKGVEIKDRAGSLTTEGSKVADELRAKGQALFEDYKARLQEAIEEGRQAAARKKEELIAQIESTQPASSPIELTPKS